jgi:hypothetical protein
VSTMYPTEQEEWHWRERDLRAEVSRLTEALEQAQRERDAAMEKVDELLECPSFQCPYEKRMRAAEAERDQQAGALGTLREALERLRIDANRLCDRQLGGTYEDDCRRSIAVAVAALAASAPAVPASTPEETK